MSEQFDVVVIGSGVGGLTTATRAVLAGWRPLVLEANPDRVGGRFSTYEVNGYRVPTGAVAVEYPGPWAKLVEEDLGLDVDFRRPNPPVQVRFKKRDVTAGAPAWAFMVKNVAKSAGGLADALRKAGPNDGVDMTLAEWAQRYTKSKTVLSLFQSLAASLFTVNAEEMKASVFFGFLKTTGGYKTIAFAPYGNVSVSKAVADEVVNRGGEVRLGWTATAIEIENGLAVAVHATDREGRSHRIPCRSVVSNIGPVLTARLLEKSSVAEHFTDRVKDLQFTSILYKAFSSAEELLPKCPGFLNMADTERLCSVVNLTATCPELAPPGRKLYTAYSVPRPSIGGVFDLDEERRLLEEDLKKRIKGYDKAEEVYFEVYRTVESPAFRCVPGTDPSVETPVPNLYDAGDGAKKHDAGTGTSGCVYSADEVVERLFHGQLAAKL
jgi:phytoene dehydrogenase-like protein